MSRFYVTTPIYYVNDAPHIGSAYTTIVCDTLARFHRARGEGAFLLTGTDEHGQKIEEAAAAAGKTPIELADGVVERFRSAWQALDIAADDFIRTTEERHKKVVADIWNRMVAAGDIYLGEYEDWYCVGCESFYPETQLLPGEGGALTCPTHLKPVQRVKEHSYFFRMSKYQQPLLDYIRANPKFIQPEFRRNEVVSFIEMGLRDLSVSRTSFKWGIPVPNDPAHVIYVWIDALTNYLSALGGPDAPLAKELWPNSMHVVGKDILRHHAVYWPTMLMSAGLPLPKTVFAHGWWTVNGQKMSKSLGNVVDPVELARDIGPDAVRYFVLRETSFGVDGDFSFDSLLNRVNSDLANDLGNLVHRSIAMAEKYVGGVVPKLQPGLAEAHPVHMRLAETAMRVRDQVADYFDAHSPTRALETLWELVRATNKYIDEAAPWQLAKDPERKPELEHTVRSFLEAIYWCALMVGPVMPRKAQEMLDRLGVSGGAERLHKWPRAWGRELASGSRVVSGEPLWPRLDDDRKAALKSAWDKSKKVGTAEAKPADENAKTEGAKAKAKPKTNDTPPPAAISFDDFSKLDLRVAHIVAAERVPKADKLLKLTCDVGDAAPRTVVAGIAATYAPETLVGKQVILVANLAPATIRGVTSHGMVLAAGDAQILGLSGLDQPVPPGTKVR